MTESPTISCKHLSVIVPAAGVGKRMKANCPKQYLKINDLTVLEHTVLRLLSHSRVSQVIIALSENDDYFASTSLANHPKVTRVVGGLERVDSVLAGLHAIDTKIEPWVMVHDAARPCVTHRDIDALINSCQKNNTGGILASHVRDTMKQANNEQQVSSTVDRSFLWHALTPQLFPTVQLIQSITDALEKQLTITDESSAIELAGFTSTLVEGSSDNIKITRPEDLALAEFYLAKQQENPCE